jgi:hypothetical protein
MGSKRYTWIPFPPFSRLQHAVRQEADYKPQEKRQIFKPRVFYQVMFHVFCTENLLTESLSGPNLIDSSLNFVDIQLKFASFGKVAHQMRTANKDGVIDTITTQVSSLAAE